MRNDLISRTALYGKISALSSNNGIVPRVIKLKDVRHVLFKAPIAYDFVKKVNWLNKQAEENDRAGRECAEIGNEVSAEYYFGRRDAFKEVAESMEKVCII